ncbi:MAG: cytochrome C554 [Planctomycetaceae bacterium]|nr:cytochrome C554 [Planctomycetaceae bacterium]
MTWSESARVSALVFVALAAVLLSGCGEQSTPQGAPGPNAPPQLTRQSQQVPSDDPFSEDAASEDATFAAGPAAEAPRQPAVVAAAGLEQPVAGDPAAVLQDEHSQYELLPELSGSDPVTGAAQAPAGAEPSELSPAGAVPSAPAVTQHEPSLDGPFLDGPSLAAPSRGALTPPGTSGTGASGTDASGTDIVASVPIAEDDPPPALHDAPVRIAETPRQDSSATAGPAAGRSVSPGDEGPLYEGWPKPAVALVLTGRQWGFLEPCGCSGLENQKGGLVRRSALLDDLKSRGWPVVPIDAGNQVRRFGRQAEVKFQITIEGLCQMGYRAIAFGPDDLRLPGGELLVAAPVGTEPSLFVCANLTLMSPDFTSRFLVIEQGGKKIGVTSVVGERNQKLVNNEDIEFCGMEEGLDEVWPELQRERCDLHVLIAQATIEESMALGKKYPQFSLVVSTGGAGEPTLQPDPIAGTRSQLIQIGTKGMYACVVGLFDDAARPLRYQRVPLDARFKDSEAMLQLLAEYQDRLRELGFEGLGIDKPQPHPSGRKFVGSAACADCHAAVWEVWKEGVDNHPPKHALAYATLQKPPKRSGIPRIHDPECISCHVVGWNPQKFFPYESGFVSLEATPELIGVGCENCHGPGSDHVDAENGVVDLTESQIAQRRQQMVLELKDAEQKCLECHDLDNSPAFQEEGAFARYWEKVKHGKSALPKKRGS